MGKTVVLIMGKSGCGKSTLERRLIETYPDSFRKVVSSTTRLPRPKETNGKDYWFITEQEYDNTDFIQTTTFAGFRYGSATSEYTTQHSFPILCVVPSSAKTFTETLAHRFPDWKTFNIYFNISNERLMANMRKRGDTEEMIAKRIAQDDLHEQFVASKIVPNLVVVDSDLDDSSYHIRVADLIRCTV